MGFAGFGVGGFLVALITEKGRMFRPTVAAVSGTTSFGH
jgi:hypothetical protein